MRVSQTNSNQVQSTETSAPKKAQAAKTKRTDGAEGASGTAPAAAAGGDVRAEISSRAKEAAKAKEAATAAPDVREQKIAELKKKIAEGKYKVDNQAVADRMVDDHLMSGIG